MLNGTSNGEAHNGGPHVSEEDVEAFITKLKQADADKKVDVIQFFGLKVEEAGVLPDTTLDAITLVSAPLLRSPSHLLVSSTLTSFLPVYLPLLPLTPSTHLRLALHHFLSPLLDKLNDPKERSHAAASANIAILGRKCYEIEAIPVNGKGKDKDKETLAGMWERTVKEGMGKGWRGKVEGMKMLLILRGEKGSILPLKPWLGTLVEWLEDGDSNVRDQARETVVALLSPTTTPPAARSEIKKLLLARNVRKTIADGIISRIFAGNGTLSGATISNEVPPGGENENGTNAVADIRSGASTQAQEEVDIVYIASGRDLDNEFSMMLPHFADKETEHNWAAREKSVVRIRGMLRGRADQQYPEAFIAGLKSGLMEGIAKTLISLRTTVAQQSCAVVLELAERLESAFDPFVENLLIVLGKMAGFTKKIIAEKSQRSLSEIIIHTTCHPRVLVNHITSGIGDKVIQTRQYCTSHLKIFIDVHGVRSRHTLEANSGLLDAIETAVKRALADVNAAVRDSGRAAFWSFLVVWPQRAAAIMNDMDGLARKQLEKAKPGQSSSAAALPPPPTAVPRKASSAMSQLLAEKRKAKAAELAVGSSASESARVVSSPTPTFPSVQQELARTTSSTLASTSHRDTPLNRSATSQLATSREGTPRLTSKPTLSSSQELQRSRSSSLDCSLPTSPPSSHGSPTSLSSPLRQINTVSSGLQSPASKVSPAGIRVLRSPTSLRKPIPSFSSEQRGTNGRHQSPESRASERSQTSVRAANSTALTPARRVVAGDLRAQAGEAISSSQSLLDFTDDESIPSVILTPKRSTKFHHPQTPANHKGTNMAWEDSPRREAMTPVLLDKLRERKHERSWWLKRQHLIDKALPLKSSPVATAASIASDVESLTSGHAEVQNLQSIALFSTSHPIALPADADEEDISEAKRVWENDRLFERVFEGLMAFLDTGKPINALEQALVLLWEMIQHQWVMFEDHDIPLCDALFRLRATRSSIILESTNSLISLLAEVSDPLFLFGVLRDALSQYLACFPDLAVSQASAASHTAGSAMDGERARASGYLFGLNGMGMCILKLPKEVVEVEARRLATVITDAMASPTSTTRQAANTLILAVQCVIGDSQATLGMFPQLNRGQKDLATYLMDRNGLMEGENRGGHEGKKETVLGEMVGLMARGASRDILRNA